MAHFQRLQRWMMAAVVMLIAIRVMPVSAEPFAQETPLQPGQPMIIDYGDIDFERFLTSTPNRTISDVQVTAGDVNGDGTELRISFNFTEMNRDGTSNTVGIIAILIGLVQERGGSVYLRYTLEDVLISGVVQGNMIGTDSRGQARANAAARLVTAAFNRYVRSLVRDLDQPFRMEQTPDGILIALILPE